jgi:hypothetical protein
MDLYHLAPVAEDLRHDSSGISGERDEDTAQCSIGIHDTQKKRPRAASRIEVGGTHSRDRIAIHHNPHQGEILIPVNYAGAPINQHWDHEVLDNVQGSPPRFNIKGQTTCRGHPGEKTVTAHPDRVGSGAVGINAEDQRIRNCSRRGGNPSKPGFLRLTSWP